MECRKVGEKPLSKCMLMGIESMLAAVHVRPVTLHVLPSQGLCERSDTLA